MFPSKYYHYMKVVPMIREILHAYSASWCRIGFTDKNWAKILRSIIWNMTVWCNATLPHSFKSFPYINKLSRWQISSCPVIIVSYFGTHTIQYNLKFIRSLCFVAIDLMSFVWHHTQQIIQHFPVYWMNFLCSHYNESSCQEIRIVFVDACCV